MAESKNKSATESTSAQNTRSNMQEPRKYEEWLSHAQDEMHRREVVKGDIYDDYWGRNFSNPGAAQRHKELAGMKEDDHTTPGEVGDEVYGTLFNECDEECDTLF
ncbi:hypothetical protein AB5N19_10700 [Seiridium cardinale]|uniref:Uncharacterized protein n=1 Tax=Seiridium cardinale TaxID=138064 RepID=A0ABR2XSN6_9PEZI